MRTALYNGTHTHTRTAAYVCKFEQACQAFTHSLAHSHTHTLARLHERWHSINIKDIHHCQLTYAACFNFARISLSLSLCVVAVGSCV